MLFLFQFYEELMQEKNVDYRSDKISSKPVNKITKFNDSDSSDHEKESDVENANDGEVDEAPPKKPRVENESVNGAEEKSIDALIEDELKDLGDRKKVHFS